MAKVTSKFQVTIPKVLAEKLGIEPGHDIEWSAAGDSIRLTPMHTTPAGLTRELRLELFDRATRRLRSRRKRSTARLHGGNRGWRGADLYDRGRTRWYQRPGVSLRPARPEEAANRHGSPSGWNRRRFDSRRAPLL